MNIKPPEVKIEEPMKLVCPFCQGLWEFRLNDSFTSATLVFYCQNCKKEIRVNKMTIDKKD